MYISKMAFIFLSNVYHPFLFPSSATNPSSLQMACKKRSKQNTLLLGKSIILLMAGPQIHKVFRFID